MCVCVLYMSVEVRGQPQALPTLFFETESLSDLGLVMQAGPAGQEPQGLFIYSLPRNGITDMCCHPWISFLKHGSGRLTWVFMHIQ